MALQLALLLWSSKAIHQMYQEAMATTEKEIKLSQGNAKEMAIKYTKTYYHCRQNPLHIQEAVEQCREHKCIMKALTDTEV